MKIGFADSSSEKHKSSIFALKFTLFFFFLIEVFPIDKFEHVDFKYENSFLKVPALKYPSKAF